MSRRQVGKKIIKIFCNETYKERERQKQMNIHIYSILLFYAGGQFKIQNGTKAANDS